MGGVSSADFVANHGGYFFASDIYGNGNTGNVASIGAAVVPPSAVPEPATAVMLLSGFGLMTLGAIRNTRKC